jgi:hypothetical protein
MQALRVRPAAGRAVGVRRAAPRTAVRPVAALSKPAQAAGAAVAGLALAFVAAPVRGVGVVRVCVERTLNAAMILTSCPNSCSGRGRAALGAGPYPLTPTGQGGDGVLGWPSPEPR